MQVTNNTTTQNYNYNSTITQEIKTSPSTFDSLLEEKKEVPEKKEGKVIASFEKHNLFDRLSNGDKKLFKDILADDNVSIEEINKLSYEEVKRLANFLGSMPGVSSEELKEMPIIHYSDNSSAIFATRMTKNEDFNKAMYKTAREITSDMDRMRIFDEVHDNLSQVNAGKELKATFYGGAYRGQFNEIENINDEIDFGKFLSDVINMHEKIISDPNVKDPQRIKQHQDLLDGYNIVQKNYTDVLNEKKEIYA
ncbi:hypothetical protein [Arcobacter sp.]|uniref:hypothetical protein n=1 Tax=Arcobacter sp. TaxID=1872629 RepID=UPI003D0CCE0B